MSTKDHVILSARKDLSRANNKITELLDFDSNKECGTNLGEDRDKIKEIKKDIDKIQEKINLLVNK